MNHGFGDHEISESASPFFSSQHVFPSPTRRWFTAQPGSDHTTRAIQLWKKRQWEHPRIVKLCRLVKKNGGKITPPYKNAVNRSEGTFCLSAADSSKVDNNVK